MVAREGLHRMNCAIEVVAIVVPYDCTPSSAQTAPVAVAAAAVSRALAAAATTTASLFASLVAAAATIVGDCRGCRPALQAGRAETADDL